MFINGWLYRRYIGGGIVFSVIKPRLNRKRDEYRVFKVDRSYDAPKIPFDPYQYRPKYPIRNGRDWFYLRSKGFENFKFEDGPKNVAIVLLEQSDELIKDTCDKMGIKTSILPEGEFGWSIAGEAKFNPESTEYINNLYTLFPEFRDIVQEIYEGSLSAMDDLEMRESHGISIMKAIEISIAYGFFRSMEEMRKISHKLSLLIDIESILPQKLIDVLHVNERYFKKERR